MHQDSLARAVRTLFPHDVPSEVYVAAAQHVRTRMDGALLQEGLARLGDLGGMQEDARAARLREMEGTRFFAALRHLAMFAVYNHPAVWARMGYEGSSMEQGGYLERGFDDIDWLPGD